MTRGHRVAAIAVLALSAPLVFGACSSDSTSDTEAADTSTTTSVAVVINTGPTVEADEFSFTPSAETVGLGETVTWKNIGNSQHTVTAEKLPDGSQPFASAPIAPESTFIQTFTEPGSYAYFCSIHPDRMSGTLTVSTA